MRNVSSVPRSRDWRCPRPHSQPPQSGCISSVCSVLSQQSVRGSATPSHLLPPGLYLTPGVYLASHKNIHFSLICLDQSRSQNLQFVKTVSFQTYSQNLLRGTQRPEVTSTGLHGGVTAGLETGLGPPICSYLFKGPETTLSCSLDSRSSTKPPAGLPSTQTLGSLALSPKV